ncbi:MAG: adenylate/guanylate cyclase domain-containing protein [Burkholderiales bacterium]
MSVADLKQRLAAILAADAAGYSRLMAGDDRATVAALDGARAVFRARIESNQGRVIDMAGDSVLALFETATGAVSAALAVQKEVNAFAEAVPEDRRMLFRIGVHLGDVIEKADGTVYGDGVNIAARLEGLAEPGRVMVSESIRTAVQGKVDASFDDRGEQVVKNIPYPVRAFALRTAGCAESRPAARPVEIDLSLPDKPSIAVLPFANMSGDPEQEYFTDGISEDIITELSRFRSLFVIARNSTFTYKGRSVDVRTVARELGVRYVLEGSIRRAANRVRVTAQLIDAATGNHVWAEKYDRVLEDIFAVQEEVTQSIVAAIAPHVESSEAERVHRVRPGNLTAHEMAMRGWSVAWVAFGTTDLAACDEALRVARDALAIDSRCSAALRVIAFAQWLRVYFDIAAVGGIATDEGIDAATRAIEMDGGDHVGYLWRGLHLFLSGRQDLGLADIRRAHELNPNDAFALASLAVSPATYDNPQKAIEFATRAIRLSPRDPTRGVRITMLAWAYFYAGEFASGSEWAQRAIGEMPGFPAPHICLVVNLIGMAEFARAQAAFQVVQALAPKLVAARLAGQWVSSDPAYRHRATTFLRIAAGLEDPGAADALR